MDVETEITFLLEQHGMVLVRERKHCVYKHPDGRSFVTSSTPSDRNASKQTLRSLRKFLGLPLNTRIKNPERRAKPGAPAVQRYFEKVEIQTREWQNQLADIKKFLQTSTPRMAKPPEFKKNLTMPLRQLNRLPNDVFRQALQRAGLVK